MLPPLFSVEGSDYEPLDLIGSFVDLPTFPEESLRQCFDIPIVDNSVTEPTETFQFILNRTMFTPTNVVLRPNITIIEIIDDDGMFRN